MSAYEVMLSESQERMLLIVKRGHEAEVRELFQRWDLEAMAIGSVTEGHMARVYDDGELVAEAAVPVLVEAPQYRFHAERPAYLAALHATPMPPEPDRGNAGQLLKSLLGASNIASKRAVYRRYDHQVQTNTMVKPGQADAAVLRLRGTAKAIAMSVDGNGRSTYLEPYVGGAMAVAEACRNVACTGALPLAVTDCLNFGNPERPEVYYQLEECIRGMADACKALGVPVVSGNVSLYNETQGEAIYPTPVVGAVGVIEDARRYVTAAFQSPGDVVLLLGAEALDGDEKTLAGSEYLAHVHNLVAGQLSIDLQAEARLQSLLVALAGEGLLRSAHDCSDGGLVVALAEGCILDGVGMRADLPVTGRWDVALFGEATSRVVVSASPEQEAQVVNRAQDAGVPVLRLGLTGGSNLAVAGLLDEPVSALAGAYEGGLAGGVQISPAWMTDQFVAG
jgi:phosphoribosylformylglycinamidine synthase